MKKPIACFEFTGPYGVGKTELAKLIAAEYLGSKEAMVKFDRMSEYYTLDKLLNRFSRIFGERQHHVLLFDQILGANEQVLDFLLKILNDGVFREYDFSNTIIILKERYTKHILGPSVRSVFDQNLNKLYNVDDFVDKIDELLVFKKLRAVQFREILDLVLVDFYEKVGNF